MIVIGSIAVAIIGWILTGKAGSGLTLGMGVFLTWALSRELDPNHAYSAFLAVGFSLLNVVYFQSIQLLVIFWILLLMRTVNGITGRPITTFDLFSGLGLTVYLSVNTKNSVYLGIFILAMIFILKAGEKTREAFVAGALSLGVFIAESFFMGYFSVHTITSFPFIAPLVIATVGISFILYWFLSKEQTKDDRGNIAEQSKIVASQILYSIAVLVLYFFGDMTFNNLIIYLSVILGATIYFIGFKILNTGR